MWWCASAYAVLRAGTDALQALIQCQVWSAFSAAVYD